MELSLFTNQLCIVLVLYKKDYKETPLFNILNEHDQLSGISVFVYDNGPYPQNLPDKRITYRHDANNSGVSKAYNEGVKFAIHNNKPWMLLLDQDTSIDLSFFKQLIIFIHAHPASVAFVPILRDHHGIVSPFRWSLGKGKRLKSIEGKLPLGRYRFANSGLVVTCRAFEKAGGYLENIPLDFSDIAFGERLQKVTDHFVVMDSTLIHSFSGSSKSSWEEALARFDFFCCGTFAMGRTFGNAPVYFLRAFLRAVYLTIRYKKFNFLKMLIDHASQH